MFKSADMFKFSKLGLLYLKKNMGISDSKIKEWELLTFTCGKNLILLDWVNTNPEHFEPVVFCEQDYEYV